MLTIQKVKPRPSEAGLSADSYDSGGGVAWKPCEGLKPSQGSRCC